MCIKLYMEQYICVLDFEATCWQGELSKHIQEIIEFPSVLYKLNENGTVHYISEFSSYVRPVCETVLSDFCTELTGITQDKVDSADPIEVVYAKHYSWLIEHTDPAIPIYITTCGAWDLQTMLPKEVFNKKLPYYSVYKRFINVKTEFENVCKTKAYGMVGMLEHLNLTLDGRHHSGIDDTKNIAKIMLEIIAKGHTNFTIHYVVVKEKKSWKEKRTEKKHTTLLKKESTS